MEKTLTLKNCIEAFLGRPGRLVSMSKSCGPAMAVYNSNLVVGDEVIWHGDIDLEEDKYALMGIARLFEVTLEVYYEMDVRVFSCDADNEEGVKKLHKEKIAKNTPVWSTADPFKYAGKDWDEMLETNTAHREKMRTRRAICYGLLTPGGTEWRWYNTWYYNGPHRLYRCFKFFFNQFIGYPLDCVGFNSYKYVDGEKVDIKLSILDKVKIFYKYFKKEIFYHKEAFRKGEFDSVMDYLFNH